MRTVARTLVAAEEQESGLRRSDLTRLLARWLSPLDYQVLCQWAGLGDDAPMSCPQVATALGLPLATVLERWTRACVILADHPELRDELQAGIRRARRVGAVHPTTAL